MAKSLKENFEYFMEHRTEIVSGHIGESVAIYDGEVIGYYPSDLDAYKECVKRYTPGTFLIQQCFKEEESYVQSFHSRVSFA